MTDASHEPHDSHQPDYSGVMNIYNELKGLGLKSEADSVMGNISKKYTPENPAPPEVIQEGLEGILARHKQTPHELSPHQETHASGLSPRIKSGLGLAAVLAGLVFLSSLSGIPYIPPPLY